MPNRVIREGVITSDAINCLSFPAEVFFYRLMLRADDYGRYDARAGILRASLYPLKIGEIREADITRWMAECQKAGLIVLYKVDDKQYIEIPKFDQRMRAKASKWPTHDRHMSDICQSSAHGGGGENRRRESKAEVRAASSPPPPKDDLEWLADLRDDPAYKGIDVAREHAKAARWCKERRKHLTRRFFINWLNRCDKHLEVKFKPSATVLRPLPPLPPELTDEQIEKNKRAASEILKPLLDRFKNPTNGCAEATQ